MAKDNIGATENISQDPRLSIIDTSLTELGFILFFIILIFSAWKIGEARSQDIVQEAKLDNLQEKINEIDNVLAKVSEQRDPDALFKELVRGQMAQQDNILLIQENDLLKGELAEVKTQVTDLVEHPDLLNKALDDVKNLTKELEVAKKSQVQFMESLQYVLDLPLESTAYEVLEAIMVKKSEEQDAKARGLYLQNKLARGNGLVYPPCWADVNGKPQYVFDVVINEDFIEVLPGWPQERAVSAQAEMVQKVLGQYDSNSELWQQSQTIFDDAVQMGCRHFVRVYDHAVSKEKYKRFLSGVENHFYKFLSPRLYIKSNIPQVSLL